MNVSEVFHAFNSDYVVENFRTLHSIVRHCIAICFGNLRCYFLLKRDVHIEHCVSGCILPSDIIVRHLRELEGVIGLICNTDLWRCYFYFSFEFFLCRNEYI